MSTFEIREGDKVRVRDLEGEQAWLSWDLWLGLAEDLNICITLWRDGVKVSSYDQRPLEERGND